MEFDPKTGAVTYDKDHIQAVQAALQEMRDEAHEQGRNQEVSNLTELAALLRLKLRK